jgi:hypothetical protein
MITCKLCNEEKDDKHFKFEKEQVRKRICYACTGKRERARLKLGMLNEFGGKCMCCGEAHPYFLSLDHVKNDGAKQRQTREIRWAVKHGVEIEKPEGPRYNNQQIYRLARRMGWPKDEFQLLCMNCNFAKGHFGECPHKAGVTVEQAYETLINDSRKVFRSRHDLKVSYRGNQWHKVPGGLKDVK